MTQWQDTDAICTRCDALGRERMLVTHPAMNVAGWHCDGYPSKWYWRPCEACAGTGYRPKGQSVPLVSPSPNTMRTR
jgi:hypothetical protein